MWSVRSLYIFHMTLKKEVILSSETSVIYETTSCNHRKVDILPCFCFRHVFQLAFTWFWASASSHGIIHMGRPADQRSSHRTPYISGVDTSRSESYKIWLRIHRFLSSSTIRVPDMCISWIGVQRVVPFWHCQQSGIRTRNSHAGNSVLLLLVFISHDILERYKSVSLRIKLSLVTIK
jgi:hypothetical protein